LFRTSRPFYIECGLCCLQAAKPALNIKYLRTTAGNEKSRSVQV
jgi:hypothetical protein